MSKTYLYKMSNGVIVSVWDTTAFGSYDDMRRKTEDLKQVNGK
jgi:hypothetical protein